MKHRAPVVIAPYSDDWRCQFQEEERLIRTVLPEHVALEHIGSTSIPNMAAKPIIDMMIGADSLREVEKLIPGLQRLGYEYMPQHELEIPERRFFAKPQVRPRQFHLHGLVKDGRLWHEHLRFRDRLRQDPESAARYAELKRELAQQYGDDRAGYTNAKSSFITNITCGSGASEA
jgi:GrpB-like predicted nucleotidyltransferase (UPF0157 family)